MRSPFCSRIIKLQSCPRSSAFSQAPAHPSSEASDAISTQACLPRAMATAESTGRPCRPMVQNSQMCTEKASESLAGWGLVVLEDVSVRKGLLPVLLSGASAGLLMLPSPCPLPQLGVYPHDFPCLSLAWHALLHCHELPVL